MYVLECDLLDLHSYQSSLKWAKSYVSYIYVHTLKIECATTKWTRLFLCPQKILVPPFISERRMGFRRAMDWRTLKHFKRSPRIDIGPIKEKPSKIQIIYREFSIGKKWMQSQVHLVQDPAESISFQDDPITHQHQICMHLHCSDKIENPSHSIERFSQQGIQAPPNIKASSLSVVAVMV